MGFLKLLRSQKEIKPYQYKPITGKDETRFISILPGNRDDPIKVKISHASARKQKNKYLTLSYTWELHDTEEERRRDHYIFVDRCTISITSNLYEALLSIREMADLYLYYWWIDMISINQENEPEKEKQIQLMPLLYPQAYLTCCWLGPDDGTIQLAFDFFDNWYKAREENDVQARISQQDLMQRELNDPANRETMHAVRKMLQNRWFTRAWTLPEIATTEKNLTWYMSGRRVLKFYHFIAGVAGSLNNTNFPQWQQYFGKDHVMLLRFCAIIGIPIELRRFTDLFYAMSFRQARRDKDLLYATQCMLEKPELYPQPDYTPPNAVTAMAFSRAAIAAEKKLDILRIVLAQGRSQDSSTPSWSLRLSCFGPPSIINDNPWRSLAPNQMLYTFNAAGGSEAKFSTHPSTQMNVLSLKGIRIDTVAYLIPTHEIRERLLAISGRSQTAIQACDRIIPALFTGRFMGMEVSATDVARALCQDIGSGTPQYVKTPSDQVKNGTRTQRLLNSVVRQTKTAKNSSVSYGETLEIPDHSRTETRKLPQCIYREPHSFVNNIEEPGYMLVTNTGLIGWASEHVNPDDTIVLLAGSSIPLVLQRSQSTQGDFNTLVGYAYVHGIMYGEAWSDELEDFHIR